MKKISIFLLLIFILSFVISSQALGNDKIKADIPSEVIIAAEKGLQTLVSIVSNDPDKFNFTSDELEELKLKEGYELYFINKEKFKNEQNIEKMLFKSDMWEFIVESNDKAKTFLTIGLENGEYKMVHFGGDAGEFQETTKEYNSLKNLKLLKIRGSYFFLNEENESQILPCFYTPVSWLEQNSSIKKSYNSDDFIKILKKDSYKDIKETTKYGR